MDMWLIHISVSLKKNGHEGAWKYNENFNLFGS
jgi:hypothetical protein